MVVDTVDEALDVYDLLLFRCAEEMFDDPGGLRGCGEALVAGSPCPARGCSAIEAETVEP